MVALISANLVNVACNWVLIFGKLGAPALGVAGAGWATVASMTYLAVFLLVAIRMKNGEWEYNPPEDRMLKAGMSVVFMSNPTAREAIGMMASAPKPEESE